MVKALGSRQRLCNPLPYGRWIALAPSTFMAGLLFSSSRNQVLIQMFVILRLKLESVVINAALVFCAGLWSYLAADTVTPLVMTKRTSNVSMQTHNFQCSNNTQISLGLRDYAIYIFFSIISVYFWGGVGSL